jgi:TolB-like protein/Tfp pilus assembly protein PilF
MVLAEDHVQRKLAAILAADVAGYSRLTGADEEGTLARLKALRQELIDPAISNARGRVVKTMGDGILVEFASAVDAMRCAVEVQRGMIARNAGLAPKTRIEFRVGIHVGDVVVDGADLLGDGVNIAARLEAISETGGISISEDAWRQVQGKIAAGFVDLGEQSLKNIARPVRVYRVELSGGAPPVAATFALPDKPSIAVLPFQNMSGDPEQEYFADGMVEDIITALSKIRWFFVIARNSSFTYKGKAVDTKQVARELGVRYVIEGSVRRAGSRLRMTAQLIDAATGNHIWAERYDRELADLFIIQDEVTASVVASIEPHLYAAEVFRVTRRPPESLNAWECVVRALGLLNSRARVDIATARSLLNKAISLDANYGRAYALLAYATALEAVYGWTPYQATMTTAGEVAIKATLLDVDDPWAHFAVGYVARSTARPMDAVVAYRKALALNPNFAWGHSSLGMALACLGQCDEALVEIDLAERLSPRDVFSGMNQLFRSWAYFVGQRYVEGIVSARKSLQENPNLVNSLRCLIINCALADELGEARSALERLNRLVPDYSFASAAEGLTILARPQDRQRALDAFRLAGLQ